MKKLVPIYPKLRLASISFQKRILSRFSVDLDFDLLDSKKEGLVFTTINEILKQYGQVKVESH